MSVYVYELGLRAPECMDQVDPIFVMRLPVPAGEMAAAESLVPLDLVRRLFPC